MTGIRAPKTSKYATQRVIDHLPMPRIAELTQKKFKRIYKYSQHDDKAEITVKDALLLDREMHGKTQMSPFLDLFRENVEGAALPAIGIQETMMKSTTALGDLSRILLEAIAAHRARGSKFSPRELQGILFALEVMDRDLGNLKAAALAHAGIKTEGQA